jgi:hypothetical protein
MGYLYKELGAAVSVSGDVKVAKAQAAINRAVLGVRKDSKLELDKSGQGPDLHRMARSTVDSPSAAIIPLKVDGIASVKTQTGAELAKLAAGFLGARIRTVQVTNDEFIEDLESFSDSRGYPAGDTISERVLGIAFPGIPKLGVTGKTVAIIAGSGALLLGAFLWKRRKPS